MQHHKFHSPFSDAQQVRDLVLRHHKEESAKPQITDADAMVAGEKLLRGVDVRSNLSIIYRWKLKSFERRFKWVGQFPISVSDQTLGDAILTARKAMASDEQSVRNALQTLDAIRGVGIPVASALLTAMHPEQFTILDRQAYKTLGAEFRAGIAEYLRYLTFCRQQATRLGVSLREHDQALWQHGVEMSRRPRRSNKDDPTGSR